MPILLLPPAAAYTTAAPASVAFSRPPHSRARWSNLSFAFPRLRKYGRRHREPVAAPSLDDDDEEEAEADWESDEGEEEMEVDEEEFLATRPKPAGFGEGKTYSTDIEEQLLREMGLGGARRRGEAASASSRAGDSSTSPKQDLSDDVIQVRVWNLPKKKNIHKDLKQAFKGFPGLLSIDPAVSANKKTRDPVCKGFAYIKLESAEAATRFVDIYSHQTVSFGKIQKPISCRIVDAHSSVEPSNKHPVVRQSLKASTNVEGPKLGSSELRTHLSAIQHN